MFIMWYWKPSTLVEGGFTLTLNNKKGSENIMDFATGNQDIQRIVDKRHIEGYHHRNCYEDLAKYVFHTDDARVCTLYGLRRTGKTTLMVQAMDALKKLGRAGEILYVHANDGDHISSLKKLMDTHPDAKYIFVDEATKMEDFQGASSILADRYAAEEGRRIVLTGTDSLGIKFALSSELFDRAHVIHTTYIPFREHSYLLDTKDIDDYIRFGGTLTDGSVFYNQDASNDPDFDYTNDAIALNIQHSLEHYDGGEGSFGALLDLYANDELTTFINKLVEKDSHDYFERMLNRSFKSNTIGSVRQLVETHPNDFEQADADLLRDPVLLERVREVLNIKPTFHTPITRRAMDEVKRYLRALEVVYPLSGEENRILFTQPGLRFSQISKIIGALKENDTVTKGYPQSVQEKIWQRLTDNVMGNIMEDVVFADLLRDKKINERYAVKKFEDHIGHHEFDVVLLDKKEDLAYLFEVKHSKEQVPEFQARHLLNPEACRSAEEFYGAKIAGKTVLYRGEKSVSDGGVSYLNAGNFLRHPQECIKDIQKVYENQHAMHADLNSTRLKNV